MTELALDDVHRHSLSGELYCVRVAQLVGSEAAPDACLGSMSAKLAADCGGRPGSTSGGAVYHAEQRARRELKTF